jgi:hypothetical protein
MHGIVGIPEPQIGFGQRRTQRLGRRHRHQALLVGAAEKNGDPHQFDPSMLSLRGDATASNPQFRDSGPDPIIPE